MTDQEQVETEEDSPVVKLANMILARGALERASAILLEPSRNLEDYFNGGLAARYRIDGRMRDGLIIPRRAQDTLYRRLKVMAEMDFIGHRPQEGVIRVSVEDRPYLMPAEYLPSLHGGAFHIRLYRPDDLTDDKDDDPAGLPEVLTDTPGLFLFVGPPDSGKTTTAFRSLIRYRARFPERHIALLEGTHSYEPPGLSHFYLNPNRGMTYATALPRLLRQNPDLLFLGDLDNPDASQAGAAWEAAVHAAEHGVRVWGIAGARDAPDFVRRRLPALGPLSRRITRVLGGLCALRLLRRPCPKCQGTPAVERADATDGDVPENPAVYPPDGECPACRGTGYRGRVSVFETLTLTPELRGLLETGVTATEPFTDAARRAGWVPIAEAARARANAGLTTPDELRRAFGISFLTHG